MRCALATLLLLDLLATGADAVAQAPRPAAFPGPAVLERFTADRWLHEGQHPGFVRFTRVEDAIHLRESGNRNFRMLTLGERGDRADLSLDPGNRVQVARISVPPLVYAQHEGAQERADLRRRMLHAHDALGSLPYARFWDVPFVVPPGILSPGREWTDTVAFEADPGDGLSQRQEGVWQNRVVGDTVMGSRRLPVVRTEGEVRYRSSDVVRDASRDASFTVEREVRGTVTGFVVVDTTLGVRAGGADTTAWSGTAVLRTTEGRTFRSGVRYERVRRWALRDSAAWADSTRAAGRHGRVGMLRLPSTALQERLGNGDTTAVDSLVDQWRSASDPDARSALSDLLYFWAARGPGGQQALRRRLDAIRRELGDSLGGVLPLLPPADRLDADHAARILPYLDDLGRLWKVGVVPTWTYGELADILLKATPIVEPDSSRWRCTPRACALLVDALESAHEPRLRDALLVGAFARDPARWYQRLRARADSGSQVVRNALLLADGVGATWPASPKDPMPTPEAGWRAWLSWMGGTVRFEDSHRQALRMYTARTGRDPVAELARAWPPPGDSARLVVGTILQGMGRGAEPTAADLAAEVLSGSPARIRLAVSNLPRLLSRRGSAADPTVAGDILAPLLDSIVAGGDAPWPALPGITLYPGGRVLPGAATSTHGVRGVPRFIRAESLPPDFASRVPAALQVVDSATWAARSLRAGGVLLEIGPIRAAGDFVSLFWEWTALIPRAPDERPNGYAGGGSLTLLRTDDGWRVVAARAWIT